MNNPPLSSPLGSYADKDEFQVGTTLVWVFGPPEIREELVAAANVQFSEIWASLPQATAAAVDLSRSELPEFWQAHDDAGTSGLLLKVWGVRIHAAPQNLEYDVGEDFYFNPDSYQTPLPRFPSRYRYCVIRTSDGAYAAKKLVVPPLNSSRPVAAIHHACSPDSTP